MKSGLGAKVETAESDIPLHALAFGEDQARYVITTAAANVTKITEAAESAGLTVSATGTVGGDALTLNSCEPISIGELTALNEGWLPTFMSE